MIHSTKDYSLLPTPPDLKLLTASEFYEMSLISEQKRVDGLVEKALEMRLKGNEFFKQNDLQNALQSYHLVLLQLRGTFEFLHLFLVRVATSYDSEVALLESNNTIYNTN